MNKRLKHDIVIPAGTIFSEAATKTERAGEGHVSHIIGLTKDSFGDLTYYVDPDDVELNDWFEDAPGTIEQSNIFVLPILTKMDLDPNRILEAAKGKLEDVLVLGIESQTKEQKENNLPSLFYFCSSSTSKERDLWIVQNFTNQLLNGFKNWVEEDD